MNIHCHTNLDLYPYERWPVELPCRPMKGDLITSNTGLELEVVRVSFKEVKSDDPDPIYDTTYVKCYVELHLPKHRFENISKFEEWYRKRRI
jgi:hypothetical protein